VFLKLDRGPICKIRRATFCSSLSQGYRCKMKQGFWCVLKIVNHLLVSYRSLVEYDTALVVSVSEEIITAVFRVKLGSFGKGAGCIRLRTTNRVESSRVQSSPVQSSQTHKDAAETNWLT
jgi:hypothetical protein